MDLKSAIIKLSQEIGIDKIGFAAANDFEHLRDGIEAQIAADNQAGFEHKNLDERLNPELIFKAPKTIIAVALAYPSKLTSRPKRTNYRRGQFASVSWGIDYHDILQTKIDQLIEGIKALTNDFDYKTMVDTGELIDVAVAERAGLGFIGKNGLLITPEFGSYVYLGEIITNIEIEPDQPISLNCGECVRCVNLCPTDALIGNGKMIAKRCLSFQTQNKGKMPVEFRSKIRTTIYGCDICQQVCPYNKGINSIHHQDELEIDLELAYPELIPLIKLTNREFKVKFGHVSGSWRGKNVLQRNAIYALGNARDRTAVDFLVELYHTTPREDFKEACRWSLSLILNSEATAIELLEKNKKT